MARLPASATSKTGATLDRAVRALPYHPDAPPKPRTARARKAQVLALPRAGAQPAVRGAPPVPGSVAALAPHLQQAIAQAAGRISNVAGGLPGAISPPAPTPTPTGVGNLAHDVTTSTDSVGAPSTAAPSDPYADLPPDVAGLLRGFGADTEARARAIQAVNDASSGAASTFANNLTTGLGQLAQLAGTPLGTAAPSDVPANVAALPGVLSQQSQQAALAQAAQAVGGAYDLPAQLQAAGMGNEAQFYGGATNDLQTMLSGIAQQQMQSQTELAKQQAADQAAMARTKLTTDTAGRTADVNAMQRLYSSLIASGDRKGAQQIQVEIQKLRNQGSADVAGINAASRNTAAATSAGRPRGAAGPFPPGTKPPVGSVAVTGGDGQTYFVKQGSTAATKPVSSSVVRDVNSAWSGKSVKNPKAGQAGEAPTVTSGGIAQMPYDQQGPELLRTVQSYGLPPAQAWRLLRSKLTPDQVRSLQYANPSSAIAKMGTFKRDLTTAKRIYKRFYEQRVLPGGQPATGSTDSMLSALVPALAKLVGLDGAHDLLAQAFPDQALNAWVAQNGTILHGIAGGGG